jgi:PleD family two-component response regulator
MFAVRSSFGFNNKELFIYLFQREMLQRSTMSSILVVDDEDQIRNLIRETLEQAGYHATEARDGKDALRQYRVTRESHRDHRWQ